MKKLKNRRKAKTPKRYDLDTCDAPHDLDTCDAPHDLDTCDAPHEISSRLLMCKVCDFFTEDLQAMKAHETSHEQENTNSDRSCFNVERTNQSNQINDCFQYELSHFIQVQTPITTSDVQVQDDNSAQSIMPENSEDPTTSELEKHETNLYPGDKTNITVINQQYKYGCKFCNFVSDNPKDLEDHQHSRAVIKPYKFTPCPQEPGESKIQDKPNTVGKREKRFKCKLCPYGAVEFHKLKRHMSVHSEDKPFQCVECGFRTKHQRNLMMHMKNIHKVDMMNVGKNINEESAGLNDSDSTQGHEQNCNVGETDTILCNISQVQGSGPMHLDGASAGDNTGVTCDTSETTERSVSNTDEYSTHGNETSDTSEATESCSSEVDGVNSHSSGKIFKCEECSFTFKLKRSLTLHKMRHAGNLPYQCGLCSFSTVAPWYLKTHMLTHTSGKAFRCQLCDYTTNKGSELVAHKAVHGDYKPYSCDICDYKSAQLAKVTRHKLIHSDVRPYKCDKCDYAGKTQANLRQHLSIHDKDRRFKCHDCDYVTGNIRDFRQHKVSHAGERRLQCKLCDYATSRWYNMDLHMKKHQLESDMSV